MQESKATRSDLNSVYQAAIQSANGAYAVSEYLSQSPTNGPVHLVAIGKAAISMVQGAEQVLAGLIIDGLVISHQNPTKSIDNLRYLRGGHPIPDQHSLSAGRCLVDYLDQLQDGARVLFLISGGSSAMVELPAGDMNLEQLQGMNRWLLASGLSISEINMVRQQVSCIKGGKLQYWLKGKKTQCLLISDVEGDDPAIIGSGLLFPSSKSIDSGLVRGMPDSLLLAIDKASGASAQYDTDHRPDRWAVVANNQAACQAAYKQAIKLGYESIVHTEYLKNDAVETGKYVAGKIKKNPGVLHIWGGETTISLPSNPGRGGRCQSLALSAARFLAGNNEAFIMAAGTDGKDGVSDYAGAIVDHQTIVRIDDQVPPIVDVNAFLLNADSTALLERSSDLLPCQYTGTNVADLIVGFYAK